MDKARSVARIVQSEKTVEGAGVHLRRVFGNEEQGLFDPFLLMDDFRGERPADYFTGFPWHPHRGIETITYVLEGTVEHGDSLGNRGVIGPGDVQWMTAGSGILHQEMPKGDERGRMGGFQLWANLPADHKMMDPRYREIKQADIPLVKTAEGATVRVVCGEVEGRRGPVQDVLAEPEYLDVTLPAGAAFSHATRAGHTVFAYVFEGEVYFDDNAVGNHTLVLFEPDGEGIMARTNGAAARFLLISGKPLSEPIAWVGPIVMNTREQLREAFAELERGTFVKHGSDSDDHR